MLKTFKNKHALCICVMDALASIPGCFSLQPHDLLTAIGLHHNDNFITRMVHNVGYPNRYEQIIKIWLSGRLKFANLLYLFFSNYISLLDTIIEVNSGTRQNSFFKSHIQDTVPVAWPGGLRHTAYSHMSYFSFFFFSLKSPDPPSGLPRA